MTPMMRNILFHGRLAMTVARNRATLTMNRRVYFPARRCRLCTFFEFCRVFLSFLPSIFGPSGTILKTFLVNRATIRTLFHTEAVSDVAPLMQSSVAWSAMSLIPMRKCERCSVMFFFVES